MSTGTVQAYRHHCDNPPCEVTALTEASVVPAGWTVVAGAGLTPNSFHSDECVLEWFRRLRIETRDTIGILGRYVVVAFGGDEPPEVDR